MQPVDVREIDEESMMWTLNDSKDYEDRLDEQDQAILITKKKELKAKSSIFSRTLDEKNAFIDENYHPRSQYNIKKIVQKDTGKMHHNKGQNSKETLADQ